MSAECHDPASDVVNVFMVAMRQAFDPASACPPVDTGSTTVHFIAGDGAPPADFTCEGPFLWVRVGQRFRATKANFPAAFVGNEDCAASGVIRAVAVEVGAMRCTSMDSQPDWDTLSDQAEISLDDSWRIERALCAAAGRLRRDGRAVAIDTVAPDGPEGGLLAWTGMAYVQL